MLSPFNHRIVFIHTIFFKKNIISIKCLLLLLLLLSTNVGVQYVTITINECVTKTERPAPPTNGTKRKMETSSYKLFLRLSTVPEYAWLSTPFSCRWFVRARARARSSVDCLSVEWFAFGDLTISHYSITMRAIRAADHSEINRKFIILFSAVRNSDE